MSWLNKTPGGSLFLLQQAASLEAEDGFSQIWVDTSTTGGSGIAGALRFADEEGAEFTAALLERTGQSFTVSVNFGAGITLDGAIDLNANDLSDVQDIAFTGIPSTVTATNNLNFSVTGAVDISSNGLTYTDAAATVHDLFEPGTVYDHTKNTLTTYETNGVARNPLGTCAIDLQTSRDATADRAGGDYSCVLGGHANEIGSSSSYCGALGRNNRQLAGISSFLVGQNHTSYASYHFVSGSQNTVNIGTAGGATMGESCVNGANGWNYVAGRSQSVLGLTNTIWGGRDHSLDSLCVSSGIFAGTNHDAENADYSGFFAGQNSDLYNAYNCTILGGGYHYIDYSYHSTIIGGGYCAIDQQATTVLQDLGGTIVGSWYSQIGDYLNYSNLKHTGSVILGGGGGYANAGGEIVIPAIHKYPTRSRSLDGHVSNADKYHQTSIIDVVGWADNTTALQKCINAADDDFIVPITVGQRVYMKILVIGVNNSNDVASYEIEATYRNEGGTVTQIGETVTLIHSTGAGWNPTAAPKTQIHNYGESVIQLVVYGELSHTYKYNATVICSWCMDVLLSGS